MAQWLKTCHHAMQAVPIGELRLFGTRQMDITPKVPYPQRGLYLDSSWWRTYNADRLITSVGVSEFSNHIPYPAVFVSWHDGDAIPQADFIRLIEWARKEARKHDLEISCVGGHGRTGTMLAGIAAKELRLTASKAVELVRAVYCPEAVETRKQENMIRKLCGEPELPPPPPVVYTAPAWVQTMGHGFACNCKSCTEARTHPNNCLCASCVQAFPYTTSSGLFE